MSNTQMQDAFIQCGKALKALETIIEKPIDPDRAFIDASIQRFEFSIELFWKLLKRIIAMQGKELRFPKEILQEAYMSKLIDDEKIWIAMLTDRNQTSHTYDQDLADIIYEHIKNRYYPIMQKTFDQLHKRFGHE